MITGNIDNSQWLIFLKVIPLFLPSSLPLLTSSHYPDVYLFIIFIIPNFKEHEGHTFIIHLSFPPAAYKPADRNEGHIP